MSWNYVEEFEKTLAANGFVVGAIIRFNHHKKGEVKQYQGKILNIRRSETVATKSHDQTLSLYLVVVETAQGVKSFWEVNMTGIEIL